MGYARYIGRIGALAVALGAGMAAPAVCAADTADDGASDSTKSSVQSAASAGDSDSGSGDGGHDTSGSSDADDSDDADGLDGSDEAETDADDELDELAAEDDEDDEDPDDDLDQAADPDPDIETPELDAASLDASTEPEKSADDGSRDHRLQPSAVPDVATPDPPTGNGAEAEDSLPSLSATEWESTDADSGQHRGNRRVGDVGRPGNSPSSAEQAEPVARTGNPPAEDAPTATQPKRTSDAVTPVAGRVALTALGALPVDPTTPAGTPLFDLMVATYRRSEQRADAPGTAPIATDVAADTPSVETLSLETASLATAATASTASSDASVGYTVTSDWGSGYVATVTVTAGDTDLDGWTVEFDSPAQITNLWSGTIVSSDGGHYVVDNAAWNGTVAAGQSVTFGFQAVGDSSATTGFVINGVGDPDPEPTTPAISVSDASAAEDDGTLTFTVSLSEAATDTVTVGYTTTNGTATAGTDYTAATGTITFTPGQTSQQVSVTLLDDAQVENTETLSLTLANPTGATLADPTATGTITNDDTTTPPSDDGASVDYTVTTDWGSGYVAKVTVTAGENALDGWTVEFDSPAQITDVWSGTIVSSDGGHYVVENAAWNGTVAAGQSVTFGFQAVGDSTATTGFVINGESTGPDPDPDPDPTTPTLSVGNATGSESAGALTFTVSLSEASTDTVTVGYTTTNGTATAGTDYTAATGTITFTPGQTSQQVTVTLLDDTADENNETFTLTLANPTGATLTDATATGVIIDNDGIVDETAWPDAVYSPFVDMGLYPPPNLVEIGETYGVSFVNLGFMQADSEGNLAWAGLTALEPGSDHEQAIAINESIAAFQEAGGKVAISMGGVANTTIAEVYASEGRSAEELAAQYESVIEAYGVDRLDFDIESSAQYDQASIDLRSEAIAIVQADYPDVEIWYTLPVLPTGLTAAGLGVVESALDAGVDLDGVNVMAMDYGESAAPTTGPDAHTMGEYAIQAGDSTYDQLSLLYGGYGLDFGHDQLGVTVMIGVNDITTEVFTTEDGQALLDYANETGLGMISIWSITRDNPGTIGQPTNYASGTDAEAGAYSDIFNDYGTDGNAATVV